MILKRIQLKEPFYNHLEWAQERKKSYKMMRQHCVHPPPGQKPKESKFVRQMRLQAQGSSTARSPRPPQHKQNSGAQTERGHAANARAAYSHHSPNAEERRFQSLELMRADDMRLLLGMKRPPEIVKKVFASLMIVVSPFETSDSDISWEAVHEWVRQLQGVDCFLDNLRHFAATTVPAPIVQSTLDYMTGAELFPATVKKFSGALATLCTWIWNVCESGDPQLTQQYRQLQSTYHEPHQGEEGEAQPTIEEDVEAGVTGPEGDFGFAKGTEVRSPRDVSP